jgi:pyruvate formate lyase activating enzyme
MISRQYLDGSVAGLEGITGYVTEVERYAIHDGYGLRTVVFLKGCPLRCRWCSNPETQIMSPEPGFFEADCIGCGRCVKACPYGTLESDFICRDRTVCNNHCIGHVGQLPCVDSCPGTARRIYGEKRTVRSLFKEVSRDIPFYERDTGGGITISGGEPLSQPEMTYGLLRYCREHWINTAIETCGIGAPEDYQKIAPYLDFAFVDLKSTDPTRHRDWTGQDHALILFNIRLIGQLAVTYGFEVVIRTPIIPGFNDCREDILSIASFISDCEGISGLELLPYHGLGRGKYASLGRDYPLTDTQPPAEAQIEVLRACLSDFKLRNFRF